MKAVELLLSDARGVYIPANFIELFDVSSWNIDVNSWAAKECQDKDNENYWDAWNNILDNAEYKENGNVWRLHQDGDLWAICYELMSDEEKENFGFNEE
jgi:hypothetical protein